jgi:hypothetical protein
MFRVDLSRCRVTPSALSGVPLFIGPVVLLREKQFRGEVFVPVTPTVYGAVHVPFCMTEGYDRNNFAVDCGVAVQRFLSNVSMSDEEALEVQLVAADPEREALFIVTRFRNAISTIKFLETLGTIPLDSIAISPRRRAVGFLLDARPEDEIGGTGVVEMDYYPLPPCTMCLDRIDRSISGMQCSPCSCPSDSCRCIFESHCVVCIRSLDFVRPAACEYCGCQAEPWLCLVCGFVGCSRYQQGHAKEHYEHTNHDISLSLQTQQIWSYVADHQITRILVSRKP